VFQSYALFPAHYGGREGGVRGRAMSARAARDIRRACAIGWRWVSLSEYWSTGVRASCRAASSSAWRFPALLVKPAVRAAAPTNLLGALDSSCRKQEMQLELSRISAMFSSPFV